MQPPVAVAYAQPMPGQQEQAVAYGQPVVGQPVMAMPMAMAQPVMAMPMAMPAAQYQQAQQPQTFIVQQPAPMEIHYHHDHPDGYHEDDDPTCGWVLFFMGLVFTPIFCCLGACATSGSHRGPRTRQAYRFNCFGSVCGSLVCVLWVIIVLASSAATSDTPPMSPYVARYAPNPPPPQSILPPPPPSAPPTPCSNITGDALCQCGSLSPDLNTCCAAECKICGGTGCETAILGMADAQCASPIAPVSPLHPSASPIGSRPCLRIQIAPQSEHSSSGRYHCCPASILQSNSTCATPTDTACVLPDEAGSGSTTS